MSESLLVQTDSGAGKYFFDIKDKLSTIIVTMEAGSFVNVRSLGSSFSASGLAAAVQLKVNKCSLCTDGQVKTACSNAADTVCTSECTLDFVYPLDLDFIFLTPPNGKIPFASKFQPRSRILFCWRRKIRS